MMISQPITMEKRNSPEPYDIARKLFACKFKNVWYNVDIRVREEKKKGKENENVLLLQF